MSKETLSFVTHPPPKYYKISSAFSYNFISALTYLEEQQKKIEEHFNEAIEIAWTSGIPLDKMLNLLTLLYEED